MGFYGNITNAASTNFTFDITYPNRKTMDDSASSDSVSIGRYVRVEYAEDFKTQGLISVQKKDGIWYWVSNKIVNGEKVLVELELVEDKNSSPTDNCVKIDQIVLMAPFNNNYGQIAQEDNKITVKDIQTPYEENYEIDFKQYGASYDGTAWVKQFKNSQMVYTLVAELNTVVPTFEITPVAPTDNPKYPHFGPESTNLNYDLHIQPPWGFRVADAATHNFKSDNDIRWKQKVYSFKEATAYDDDNCVIFTLNQADLNLIKNDWTVSPYKNSDASYNISNTKVKDGLLYITIYTTTPQKTLNEFTENNGNNFIIINQKYNGAIYYNKDGFVSNKPNTRDNSTQDIITLIDECSGTKYLNPATGQVESELPDTKGLVINLPSLGNAVSDTYDLLYGTERNNDPESLAGKLSDLDYQYADDGTLLLTNHYTRTDGQKGTKIVPIPLKDEEKQYYKNSTSDENTFHFNHSIEYEEVKNLDKDTYENNPGKYYIQDGVDSKGNPIYKLTTKQNYYVEGKSYYLPKGKLDIKFDLHLKNGGGDNSLVQYSYQDQLNSATGAGAAAFGFNTSASGNYSHAEGRKTEAIGANSHTEGYKTEAQGDQSHAEGHSTITSGGNSHAEGYSTIASGKNSHAEGRQTQATNHEAHAEGVSTYSTGFAAHAEGYETTASGQNAHAEGCANTASGSFSHAEGYNTTSSGAQSHAEGAFTQATEFNAHAEGYGTQATGNASHSEGYSTIASGSSAHAEGNNTIALGESQHVQGKYNVEDASKVHIVGWGENDSARKNIHTIDTQGNAEFAGNISFGDNIPYLNGRNLSNIISGLEYEDIKLNSFTVNDQTTHNYEIGTIVQLEKVKANFSQTNGSYHTTTLTIKKDGENLVEPIGVEDKENVTQNLTDVLEEDKRKVRKTNHGEYVTITATIKDELAEKGAPVGSLSDKDSSASQNVKINFYYKAFVFVGDENSKISFTEFSHDSFLINGEYEIKQSKLLTNTKENSKGTYTWNTVTKPASGKQYVYVLSPKAATFSVGGFSGGFELVKENIVFNLPEGNETYTGYKLYRTIQPQSGDIKELKTII